MLASSHGTVIDMTGHNREDCSAAAKIPRSARQRHGAVTGAAAPVSAGWSAPWKAGGLSPGASASGDARAGYDSYIGGLAGFSTGTIRGASASGKVGGSGLLGGLVAWNQGMSWVLRPAAGWSRKSPTRSMAD